MKTIDFQSFNKALRIEVKDYFWHSSSCYDEVIELVLEDIKNNRIDYSNYIIGNMDELAFKLMHDKMVQVGHL